MLRTRRLEFNIVEHCNLRCLECSHLSPWMPRKLAELDIFERDIAALSAVLACEHFRFVGGEPLLHPGLESFIRVVRNSGIAAKIDVVTNGTEILKQPDSLFRSIQRLELSYYPDTATTAGHVEHARLKCAEAGIEFQLLDKHEFRSMQLDRRNDDEALVRRIYGTCEIAHGAKCHVLRDGWYYKCSRPPFTGPYLERKGLAGIDLSKTDGVAIHEPGLESRLERYIADKTPLESCRYCLGTVGKGVSHRQMPVAEVRSAEPDTRKPSDLVDFELLEYLERAGSVHASLQQPFMNSVPARIEARFVSPRPARKPAPPRRVPGPPPAPTAR